MPLDFRYHLASLTAVFVALIIGILLGVAMTDAPGLGKQIQDLQTEFSRAQVLQNVDDQTNRFNERTQALLVKNRMFGRNVVLVQNTVTFPDKKMAAVRDIFAMAGANITAEVALKPTLLQVTPEQARRVYMRVQRTPPAKAGTANLMRLLATDLGSDLFHVAPALQKEKLISVRGDTTLPISTVVLLGGEGDAAGETVKMIDMPFLQACDERALRLAAVEQLQTTYSAIPLYRKAAPITVDNIDRAAGRIALIFALSENQAGDYGYKSTANDVMPEINE
ncbi:MAG: copper transporter [Armatimonadota bacterium]